MVGPKDLRRVIPRNAWASITDLESAFFSVPIHRSFSKFLAFRVADSGRTFKFVGMPMGFNQAPWIFTKLLKVVQKWLRIQGVHMLIYLDDIVVWDGNKARCIANTKLVRETLRGLGFILNQKKSSQGVAQKFNWLGLTWDTKKFQVGLKRRFIPTLVSRLKKAIKEKKVSLKEAQTLEGKLNWAASILPLGRVQLCPLIRLRNRIFPSDSEDPFQRFPLPNQFIHLLRGWTSKRRLSQKSTIRIKPPSFQLTTDASRLGWGAVWRDLSSQTSQGFRGRWSPVEKGLHINILETMAIHLGLLCVQDKVSGSTVEVLSDNAAAVATLTKQGTCRSVGLFKAIEDLLIWGEKQQISLKISHIQGIRNVEADRLSREGPLPTEWELSDSNFDWILGQITFPLEVDLFATRFNAKLQKYVSPYPDGLAIAVNALTQDWSRWKGLYIFPPTNAVKLVIEKLASIPQPWPFKIALVAPVWPNQAWFPQLQDMFPLRRRIPNVDLIQTDEERFWKNDSPDFYNLHLWTA